MTLASEFPPGWWDERRKRDYYVDADGHVQLKPDSPTGERLFALLMRDAIEIAAEIGAKSAKLGITGPTGDQSWDR